MRRVFDDDEDDDEEFDEPLSIDEDAQDDGGEADDEQAEAFGTMPCPYCGKPMSDLAEVCPHCRSFVSREDVPADRKPRWVVIATILLLIALTIGVVSFR